MGLQTHNLNLNQAYFFSFQNDINMLNGLYTVQAILQFDEVEAFLEDPVYNLYQVVNKIDMYESDLLEVKYRYEVYYKLQTIEEPYQIYFVPDCLILPNPSSEYKEMFEYALTAQIGIIDNAEELDNFMIEICNVSRRTIGITPVLTLSTYNKKYVPLNIINDHTKSRNIIREVITPEREIKELQDKVTELTEKLRMSEKIIIGYEKFKNKLRGMIISN